MSKEMLQALKMVGHVSVGRKDHDGNGEQPDIHEQGKPAFARQRQAPTPPIGLGGEPIAGSFGWGFQSGFPCFRTNSKKSCPKTSTRLPT
jgi:hypothetical protein